MKCLIDFVGKAVMPHGNQDFTGVILLPNNLNIFQELQDDDSDSDISIISDPFSIASMRMVTQRESRIGQDLLDIFNFSHPLQSILAEFPQKEMKTMMFEALDQIRKKNIFTQVKKKVPLVAQIKIVNLLNSRDMDFGGSTTDDQQFVPDEKKTWEDLKDEVLGSRNIMKNIRKLTEKERSKKVLQEKMDLQAYETMSGYWRLLGEYDDFQISPPNLNSYPSNDDGHWLHTTPIPAVVMEESRNKVMAWFAKYFHPNLQIEP